MLFDVLNDAVPIQEALVDLPAVNFSDPLWEMLKRLLVAHAPSGGANLLGGIGDDIAVLAEEVDLGAYVEPQLGSTGNTAISLGSEKAANVVVVAHMDRPSFRVKSVDEGTLYPICANRFPQGEYHVSAKAVRFDRGRLVVGAQGVLISQKAEGQEALRFESALGTLAWQDTILMDVNPVCDGSTVTGSGLDNCLGVLMALLTAAVLRQIEDIMIEQDRRCLFVFTDQEEGPPDGFFGHGAARLMHALRPPTYGCVIVDAHTAGPTLDPKLGKGVSHGAVSGWGRGAVVPPNYHALALELAGTLNAVRPDTIQMNNGHLSRSDDMILSQWTRILALSGPPMTDPHTGRETARLSDIQSGVWWLSYFLAAALNLVPELAPKYALGR
jgi:putative aminopeptidase FrvX